MGTHPSPAPETIRVAEIRHRMSNGFQILQAFTRQQIRSCDSQEAVDRLGNLLTQIETVAAQQSALSEADTGNFSGFIEAIEPLWQRLGDQSGVAIEVDLDGEISFSPTVAETASRILLEAVTNCIEHAFPGDRGGIVEIKVETTDVYHCECRVIDNGVGFEGDRTGQGTGIIRSLAETLGGQATWSRRSSGGTVLSVEFPVNLPDEVEAMNKARV